MTGKVEFPVDNSACWRHILEKEGLLQVSMISSSCPVLERNCNTCHSFYLFLSLS